MLVLVRDDSGEAHHLTVMLEDIDARKRTEAELIHRSNHDTLTSLPTRAYFLDRLHDSRERAALAGTGLGVIFIDLDNFKQVNDTAGHRAGDELLSAIAAPASWRCGPPERRRRTLRRRRGSADRSAEPRGDRRAGARRPRDGPPCR